MTYKLELILVLKKNEIKKLINIKSLKNYVYFMIYLYWTPRFYIKLTHFAQKIKKNLD